MPLDPSSLPKDTDQLRAMLIEMSFELDRQNSALISSISDRDAAITERDHFKSAYEEADAERRRLDDVLQKLLRRQSGPKSERLDPEQFPLALENHRARSRHPGRRQGRGRGGDARGEPAVAGRPRPSETSGACPNIFPMTRSGLSRRARSVRVAAGRCMRSAPTSPSARTSYR